MQENEIQKLISIFLGLAILVSSGIFVISGFVINQNNEELKIQNLETQNSSKNQPKSAFVESPKDLPNYYSTISLDDEFQPTGNLTDDFASYVAREIVKANPNGPQIDENGQNITIPDIESLTTNFATNTLSKINLPDWDKEVNDAINKTKFVDDDSINTLVEYLDNFNKISQLEIIDNNLLNKFESDTNTSPEIVSEVAYEKISNVFNKISNLTVPKKAENFHKNFIKLLVYQKNLLSIYQKINTDPLYVFYSIKKNQPVIDLSLENIKNESKKIKNDLINKNNSSNTIKNKFGFINIFIFKIQKANAFIVHDPGNTAVNAATKATVWAQLAHILMEWGRKLATEILKDQLIHKLVQQTIRWVQGGGKPQFITDWKGFLTDAVSRGVGEALYQIYPRICQPFRPLVEVAFQNVGNIYDEYVACTLGDIVNNLRNFYNDFRYGGWIAYGSILRPENNYWGELLITHDIAMQKGAQEKEAQKSDVQASKGFLSMKKCVKEKKSAPIPRSIAVQAPKMPNTKLICGPVNKPELNIKAGECIFTTCEEYENTTPGGLIADITSQAVGNSPIARIVNAQDVTALVSALVNSGLNKLIQAGQKGLTSLFNSKETSPTQNTVTDINDPCFGEVIGSESYNECRGVTSGNGMYKTDTGYQQTFLLQKAKDIYNQLNDNISKDNEYLGIAPGVQSGLEQIGGCDSGAPLCPDLSSQACELKNKIEEEKNRITNEELPSLENALREIQGIMNELYGSGPLPLERISEINEIILRYNGEPGLYAPQKALDNLKDLQSAVNQNISGSPQCQIPLPQL